MVTKGKTLSLILESQAQRVLQMTIMAKEELTISVII